MKHIDLVEGYKVVCLCGRSVTPTDDSQIRTITLGPSEDTAAVSIVTLLCDEHKDAPKELVFIEAIRYIAAFRKALVVE